MDRMIINRQEIVAGEASAKENHKEAMIPSCGRLTLTTWLAIEPSGSDVQMLMVRHMQPERSSVGAFSASQASHRMRVRRRAGSRAVQRIRKSCGALQIGRSRKCRP